MISFFKDIKHEKPSFTVPDSVTNPNQEILPVSLGELSQDISKKASNLISIVKKAECLASSITNPEVLYKTLSLLSNSITSVAMGFGMDVFNLVKQQYNYIIAQIFGRALAFTSEIIGYINSILNLTNTVLGMIDFFKNIGKEKNKFWLSNDDCAYMLANIGRCLLNKMLGDKLDKLKMDIKNNVVESTSEFSDYMKESLNDVDVVNSYLKKERFMIDKANAQLQGFNRL